LGEKSPIVLFLAAVGALKFGFDAFLATFWDTLSVKGDHWATYKK